MTVEQRRQSLKEQMRSVARWVLPSIVVFAAMFASPMGERLEFGPTRIAEFKVREWLGRSPRLHPKLKIFAYDDQTAGLLQKFDLRLADWGKLIRVMSDKKPAAIFVDKIWTLPIGKTYDVPVSIKEGQAFISAVRATGIPVTVGGSVFSRQILQRESLPLTDAAYDRKELQDLSQDSADWLPSSLASSRSGAFFYGPQKHIRDAFTHVGQLDFAGMGRAHALVQISYHHVIPHAGLLALQRPIKIRDGQIHVGSDRVFVHSDGTIPVNYPSERELNWSGRTRSLIDFIRKSNAGTLTQEIEEGDIVVVLPSMYTGNVDWIESPIGDIQGGFLPAALINSQLNGEWLRPVGRRDVASIFAGLVAFAAAVVLPMGAMTVLTAATVITAVAGLASFAYAGVILPWSSAGTSFFAVGMIGFVVRARRAEVNTRRLREALEGTVPPDRLAELLMPGALRKDPSEQLVTIMFIDMVGFSLVAERLSPKVAFDDLKNHLGTITSLIHKHGGIIDKFLGDGVLCFFGYSFMENSVVSHHADAALRCAVDIQRSWQEVAVKQGKTGQPVYPLRIGVNTASVYIGDVGRGHVHFTLIGQGVNFANRLEQACEPFRIMVGPATFDNLSEDLSERALMERRFIQVKHHDSFFDAWECNPFVKQRELLNEAMAAYQKSMAIASRETRYPMPKGGLLCDFGMGPCEVVNFSSGGLAVETSVFPASGVRLQVNLTVDDAAYMDEIRRIGILPIQVEVRWGFIHEQGAARYRVGLQFRSLNAGQVETLIDVLRRYSHVLSERKPEVA